MGSEMCIRDRLGVFGVAFALYQLIGKLSRVIDRFAEADFSQLFSRDR